MKRLVKEQLLSILLWVYISVLRVLRSLVRDTAAGPSVLILPPYSPGSLGDEAVLTSAVKEFSARGMKKIGLISPNSGDNWEYLGSVTEIVDMQDYFSYGSWRLRFRFARLVSRYERFYLFGTDMMDGFYNEEYTLKQIAIVALAAKTGARATIASFSFNKHPTPASVKALRNLPAGVKLCSRDPISYARLMHHLDRPIELVADVAFLLQPSTNSEIVSFVSNWIRLQKSADRTVCGINVNHLLLRQVPRLEPEDLVQIFACAMTELLLEYNTLSFLLIPHDTRGKISDVWLADAILEVLPPEIQLYCMRVPTLCRAVDIKALCAELDVVLSGKMHLAIACLGQGIPVACITYQDKFEGMFKHFELDGMTIDPERALQPGNLSTFFKPLIKNREEIRRHVRSKLPQIKKLARANFG